MRTFEYRLKPNKIQEAALWHVLIESRKAYNEALEELIDHYKITGKHLAPYDQDKLHGKQRHPDLPAVVVDTTLARLHRSFDSFFRGIKQGKKGGYPRFKSARRWMSFDFRDEHNYLRGDRFMAGKICGGLIKTVVHRPMYGKFKYARVIRRPSGWHLQCVCETQSSPLPAIANSVGLDLGVTAIVADSEGKRIKNPRHFKQALAHLAKLQRHKDCCQRGSNRRKKSKHQLARLHEHIANQRKDSLHKISREYANNYQTIVIEDLNIAGMVRNHNLAQAITDSSWGMLRRMLTYKAEEAGRQLVIVPPHYTSQKCSSCGTHVQKALSVRTHRCPFCGYLDDRDVNAAKNILAAGLARMEPSPSLGEGPTSVGESPETMKREAS